MAWSSIVVVSILFAQSIFVVGQQECYFGPGAVNRGPSNLVPCNGTGTSTCCLLGDTCLSGNTCYNYATGDLYQYGCTDISYQDKSCPYKCGWDPTLSPWTALEYCTDIQDLDDTWVCHAPESCGCSWSATYNLLVLQPIGCKEMGDNARVALYAPSTLVPYVSLPSTIGGSTGYYSTTVVSGSWTWISTAIAGYTPSSFTQFTTYRAAPTEAVLIASGQAPAPSTYSAAKSYIPGSTAPSNTTPGSASAFPTTTSSTLPTNATLVSPPASRPTSPSSSLSTHAKIGIGIGAAGGAFLLALLIRVLFLARNHRRERRSQQPEQQYGQYPQSSPMTHYSQSPPLPYYYSQGPAGSQWAPYPVHVDGMGQQLKQPASPPIELSVDGQTNAHEIGSDVSAASPPTPSPLYGHTQRR